MNQQEIKVCVLRVGGTNCDAETQRAFVELGVQAEVLHVNELIKRKNLLDYAVLVFPGGFSFGDYVRSGVIFARHLARNLARNESLHRRRQTDSGNMQRLPNSGRIRFAAWL